MSWWRIAKCTWDDTRALNAYLTDGWDPFAVTDGSGVETFWLRRSSDRERSRFTSYHHAIRHHRNRDADLEALVAGSRGDVSLIELRWRCCYDVIAMARSSGP